MDNNVIKSSETNNFYCDGRPYTKLRMDAKDEGVVLRHGQSENDCDNFGARDIWVWEHDGTYFMHYDAADKNVGWLCSLATSTDLFNWTKHGTVLDLGEPGEEDSRSASYGSTYYDGNSWHMFYLGTPNVSAPPERVPGFPYLTMKAKAASPYGPWIKQKDVIPFRPAKGSYYEDTASPGHIIKQGEWYYQFFSTSVTIDGIVKRTISVAKSKDLDGSWIVDPEPLLPIEEQIENTSLYYEPDNDTWFLFTNHVGLKEDVPEYTDAIWVYWTKDLLKWNPDNKAVVLDNTNCKWSKNIIGLPSVIKVGDRLAIFYDGLEGEGYSHCHRDIGLAWLELPLKPPLF